MAQVSPAARALARQVLLYESEGRLEAEALAQAADRAYTRLGGQLIGVFGATGYATLCARAMRLAKADYPALEHVTVDPPAEGRLHGTREFARAHNGDAEAVEAGLTAILAYVVGLLAAFIREDLVLRLVRGAWPDLAPSAVDVGGRT